MRIELYFELEKNIIPSDNRAMFVSFLKKTLEECNQGKYYEHYFTGTDRKDYCFVPLFDKPQYEKDKIILASPRLKLIFSVSDKSKIGQIFYFAFIGMKHKRFPLPDKNSMILKKIVKVQEEVITSDKVIFRTVPGGGLIIREHFRENNTDNYYTINDKEFEEKAGDSLKRQAIYAGFAENEVQEIKIKTISGKKVVTRIYKQFIDISIGFFLIEAKPEILQYFYQVGVGGHSSMGYGLLQIIQQI